MPFTELQDLCDEIGMMKNGEMVTGSIEEITRDRSNSRIIEIELIQPSARIEEIAVEWPTTFRSLKQLTIRPLFFEISHSGDKNDLSKFLSKTGGRKPRSCLLLHPQIESGRLIYGNRFFQSRGGERIMNRTYLTNS